MKCFFIFLICIPFISFSALAMNFIPEVLYESVVVVYTDTGVGSGFAINENTIITNAHVVGNYKNVTVNLYNDKSCVGKVVKIDTKVDLALIQTDEALTSLKINTNDIHIGKEVYAIGAPNDIPYTMTKGIISANNRKIGDYSYIQIDASINSGNSGGPLVDENGEVIGINTLKMENAEGIGFAIGTSYINEFINDVSTQNINDKDTIEESTLTPNEAESNYIKVLAQNEKLKIAIIILSTLLLIAILIILKLSIRKKIKDEYDFEIEIED